MILRSQIENLLWPGLAFINLDSKYWSKIYPRIYKTIATKKAFDVSVEYVPVSYATQMNEADPFDIQTNFIINKTIANHVTYGIGIEFSFESIDDNLYLNEMISAGDQIKMAQAVTMDLNGANPFNLAFNNSYPIGDGQPLASASHPTNGGVYTNLITPATLSETALTQMVVVAQTFPDASNKVLNYQAEALLCTPQQQFDAERIIRNPDRPATANRDIGVVYTMDLIPKGVIVSPYLTTPTSNFLLTNCPNSRIFYEKNLNDVSTWMDEKNRVVGMGIFSRYSFVFADARGVVCNQGF